MARNKKTTVAEIIYFKKALEIYFGICEEIDNNGEKISPRLLKKIEWLGKELMKQDIRVAIATGLIEIHPYPTFRKAERQRLEEVNEEIENYKIELNNEKNNFACHQEGLTNGKTTKK